MSGLPWAAGIAVAGVLFAAECDSTARAAFPGANGRIAFDAANSEDLTTQVYTVNASGRDLRWVSDAGQDPAFSADHSQEQRYGF